MESCPTKGPEDNSGANFDDGGLSKMPSYEDFDRARSQGVLPEGIRDEQDYREFMAEKSARESEARAMEEEKFAQEDARVEAVLAEMEDEDFEIGLDVPFCGAISGFMWKSHKYEHGKFVERRMADKFAIWQLAKTVADSYTPDLDRFEEQNLIMKFDTLYELWRGLSLDEQRLRTSHALIKETKLFLSDENAPLDSNARYLIRRLQCTDEIHDELMPFKQEYTRYKRRQEEKSETQ